MPSIPSEQIKKAVTVLNAFVKGEIKPKNGKKEKDSLFEREEEYQLVFTLRKIPQNASSKPTRIPIPHTYHGREGARICLFTKDPQAEYETLLERNPVKNVKAVISLSKLRKDYAAFQHRRQLLSEFDFFLTDDRVLPMLPNLIGKNFFAAKKQPAPVNISKSFKKDIIAARDSTYLFLNSGVTSTIRLGNQDFTVKQIVENAEAVIAEAVKHIPRQWKNIQAIHLKTTNSASLPIYNSLSTVEDFTLTEEEVKDKELEVKIRASLAEKRKAEKLGLSLSEMRRFTDMATEMKVPFKAIMELRRKNQLPTRESLKSAEEIESDIAAKIAAGDDDMEEDEDDFDEDLDEDALMELLAGLEEEDMEEDVEEDEEEEEPTPVPTPVAAPKKRAAPEPVKATKVAPVVVAAPAAKKQKAGRK